MPFQKIKENMMDSNNRLDGFETGRLIVDRDKKTAELEQIVKGNTLYLTLTEADRIEVRNGDTYVSISHMQALLATVDGTDWPLYAGQYARVRVAK